MNNIIRDNKLVLEFLSKYLDKYSTNIEREDIINITCLAYSEEYAYSLMLANMMGLDIIKNEYDKYLFDSYFIKMVKKENEVKYKDNPYFKFFIKNNIKSLTNNKWELRWDKYESYQAFVRDDFIKDEEGRIIPQIGFFSKTFKYPSIYQNDRLWMTITPNEVNTMENDINDAFGNICVCGLGLGYFAYMTSLKENICSITIIEKDRDVIKLFKDDILPFYEYKDKITIIEADAIDYLKSDINYDYIYIDLWHDVSDGLNIYKELKKIERNNITYRYWIEKTIKAYL